MSDVAATAPPLRSSSRSTASSRRSARLILSSFDEKGLWVPAAHLVAALEGNRPRQRYANVFRVIPEAAELQVTMQLARASGKVRRGIGAARQDVNVSIAGSRRIEIKGVPSLRMIPRLTHNEALRQRSLVGIRGELIRRGVTADDIKLVVPHQANIRIINSALDKLGIEHERAAVVLHRTGNTSAASIPLALADALDTGRVDNGDLVLLVGFGGGMTAASCVLRWGGGLDD